MLIVNVQPPPLTRLLSFYIFYAIDLLYQTLNLLFRNVVFYRFGVIRVNNILNDNDCLV